MRQAAGHWEAPGRQAWAGAAGRWQGEETDGRPGAPRQEASAWTAGDVPGRKGGKN